MFVGLKLLSMNSRPWMVEIVGYENLVINLQ
jgi:hypothetical protein